MRSILKVLRMLQNQIILQVRLQLYNITQLQVHINIHETLHAPVDVHVQIIIISLICRTFEILSHKNGKLSRTCNNTMLAFIWVACLGFQWSRAVNCHRLSDMTLPQMRDFTPRQPKIFFTEIVSRGRCRFSLQREKFDAKTIRYRTGNKYIFEMRTNDHL